MPFRDDLLNPIPGDNPAGVNLRYDPVADKIKEARREDAEMPQGAWKTALKVADYGQVIKLAGEAIAARGKDLQIAVWLVDAHVRREGFAALAPGFRFLHGLVEQFWDGLYPELEDGDAEMRSAVLEWLGTKLPEPVRALPITANKLSWNHLKESRVVGYEADATSSEKQEQRNALIGEGKPTAEEFDQAVDDTTGKFYEDLQALLEDALTSLGALSELCDQKFGDVSPSFIKTRDALGEIAQTVRGFINKKGGPSETAEPEPQEEEAPAAYEEPAAAAVSAGGAAAAPARAPRASAGAEPSSVEDAAARVAVVARYLRQQDQYNIGAFLILRGLRFGEIRYNGPQIDPSMLEAPSPELRKQLKQAALDGDADRILDATEAAMELPCGRAWLDAQRYTVRALESKGEYFKFVADAVRSELRGLLHDLPGLLDMTLTDDTPVANAETLAWIRDEVLPPASADAAPAAPPPEPEPAPEPEWRPEPAPIEAAPPSMERDTPSDESGDVFDTALAAAQEGRLDDAITMLSAELERARSGRGRFRRRMQLAHLFLAAGHEKVAYPILEDLAAEIDRRGLEEWEAGDVLAHPLSLLLRCARSMGADEERLRSLYARICRLAPQKALHCLE